MFAALQGRFLTIGPPGKLPYVFSSLSSFKETCHWIQGLDNPGWSHLEILNYCVCAKSLQSYLALCNTMNCSSPGSSVYEILSARILEWVAMPSPPGDLPDPGIKPMSLRSPALADRFFTTSATWEDIHTWVLANSPHMPCVLDSKKCSPLKRPLFFHSVSVDSLFPEPEEVILIPPSFSHANI